MVLFERGIPHIYEGDLMQEEELLGWLIHQKKHTEIPEVTDEMKDKLIETFPHVAVIFCELLSRSIFIYSQLFFPIRRQRRQARHSSAQRNGKYRR